MQWALGQKLWAMGVVRNSNTGHSISSHVCHLPFYCLAFTLLSHTCETRGWLPSRCPIPVESQVSVLAKGLVSSNDLFPTIKLNLSSPWP